MENNFDDIGKYFDYFTAYWDVKEAKLTRLSTITMYLFLFLR